MLQSGVVSATFREKRPSEIISLCQRAGISGIEWSTDVHVPPQDLNNAKEIKKLCEAANIKVCGLASYYKLRENGDKAQFEELLAVANELKAPTLRVWAGELASCKLSEGERNALLKEARRLSERAFEQGVILSYEYHADTFTDTLAATQGLLEAAPLSKTHWQVPPRGDAIEHLVEINALGERIATIHAQYYIKGCYEPLSAAAAEWQRYIDAIAKLKGNRFVCIEFVKNGEEASFFKDAKALNSWLLPYKI